MCIYLDVNDRDQYSHLSPSFREPRALSCSERLSVLVPISNPLADSKELHVDDYPHLHLYPGAASRPENDCQQVEVLLARTFCPPMLRFRSRSRDTIRVRKAAWAKRCLDIGVRLRNLPAAQNVIGVHNSPYLVNFDADPEHFVLIQLRYILDLVLD